MTAGKPVVVLADPDYCYGIGPLTLRVHHIDYGWLTRYDGENWYPVPGVPLGHGGQELSTRDALVRGRRLPPLRSAGPPAA